MTKKLFIILCLGSFLFGEKNIVISDTKCIKRLGIFVKFDDANPIYVDNNNKKLIIKDNWGVLPESFLKTIDKKYLCKGNK